MSYRCEYCGKEFDKPVTSGHKRKCPEFLAANPDRKPIACLCGHESTSLTQMKRHRKMCEAWQSRNKNAVTQERIKSTFQKKYGEDVTNAIHVPGAVEKKEAICLEKYGAKNPFSKESSLYDQVQAHWDGKDRTAHLDKNNFARPEIKEKIRQTNLEKYGVANPSQVPEIRAKQLATNLERYGDEQTLRVLKIREKGRRTNIERFGVPDPAQSPEILEKIKQTNLARYGVEWTPLDPKTRVKMDVTQISHFGVKYFASDKAKQMLIDTAEQRLNTIRMTNMERFGAPHFMQNPDLARKHLAHQRRSGPNSLELAFQKQFPQFMFVGDGSYWRFLPRLGCNKNPDFILPGSCGDDPLYGAHKIVEIFGDYWHSDVHTGKSKEEHQNEIIEAWEDVGMDCLILWEQDIKLNNDWINSVLFWCSPIDFSFDSVLVDQCAQSEVIEFLSKHHYAGFGRASKIIFTAKIAERVIGVAKFATPVRQGIAPTLDLNHNEVLELDRFCIDPDYHKKNFASHFMSKVIKRVSGCLPSIKALVSFADPRFGHIGTIYKASNWEEMGQTSRSYIYLDKDNNEINKKSVYDRACASGLKEREYVENVGLKKVPTPAKIKYVYRF